MNNILDQLKERLQSLKVTLLGSNNEWLNERIDYFLDSFYKLNPEQRSLAVVCAGVVFFLLFASMFAGYRWASSNLERELNDSFEAMYRLQELKGEYKTQESRMKSLTANVKRKTSGVRLRPFFEQKASEMSTDLRKLSERTVTDDKGASLGSGIVTKEVVCEFKKISLPRLLNFLIEIEKSDKFLTVAELRIRGRFKDKLYFDSDAKIRGYQTEN